MRHCMSTNHACPQVVHADGIKIGPHKERPELEHDLERHNPRVTLRVIGCDRP